MGIDFYQNLDLSAKGVLFPIISSIITLIILIFMPKRLTKGEIYITIGVIGYTTFALDIFIMATMFDVFDLGSPYIVGLGDIISYGVVATGLGVIFLNFYSEEKKWLYVASFSLISLLYEIILVNIGYMDLKGWNSFYSIPVHIICYGFWFPWHLKLMRRM